MTISPVDVYLSKSLKSKSKKIHSFIVKSFEGNLLHGYKGLKLYYLASEKRVLGVFEGWKGFFTFKLN